MFEAIETFLTYSFYSRHNQIIYTLKSIPLLKKIIPDKFYKVYIFKDLNNFFAIISEILTSIGGKIFYYYFCKLLLKIVFNNFDLSLSKEYILSFMMVLSIVGFIKSVNYFKSDKKDYILVKIIRLSPKKYYMAKIYYEMFFNVLSYSLVFGFIFRDIGISFQDAFSYAIFLFSLRSITSLNSANRYKKRLTEKTRGILDIILLVFFILIGISYLIYSIISFDLGYSLFWQKDFYYKQDLFLVISLITLALSLFLFIKTEKIEKIARIKLRKYLVDLDPEELKTSGISVSEKDFEIKKDDKSFEEYEGIEYINRIFFFRLRNKFYKSIRIKSLIIFILMLIFNFFIFKIDLSKDKQVLEFFAYGYPMMGFLLGLYIYIGDKFTRLCFFNMDRFLMKNSFYRKSESLKESIKIRFKKMIIFNLPMLLIFLLGTIYPLVKLKVSLLTFLLTFIFAIIGMVFFNFHYLYAYYLLQPFTENMDIKNPFYSIFNFLAYFIVTGLLALSQKFKIYSLVILLIFSIFYIIIGYYLVKKHAHKRFKLR